MNWFQKIRLSQKVDDDYDYEKAERYFSIGHGDLDEDTGVESAFQVWAYIGGEIRVSPIVTIDPDSGRQNGTATHGAIWGHDICDRTYKGRYEVDTGRISIVNPKSRIGFPIPQNIIDMLHQKFPGITQMEDF